jgi:phage-related protein
LKVEIIGDASSFHKALGSATNTSSRFGGALRSLGKVALGAGVAITAGFAVTLKRGFDELADAQKVAAQTGAVLESTGKAANVSAKQVADYAQALSEVSGVDDEVIQGGENMLLTFTNIRNETGKGNDVFKQATATLLDMSTALGTDMNKSAIQLGKALNDPIKGLTALQRVGVSFTEGQKATIAQMVKTGDVMGAQKLILAELNREFGGSAAAFGETMPGQLAKARNAFDEIAGNLATKFLPMLTQLLNWVNQHWPEISAVIGAAGTAIVAVFNVIGVTVNWLRSQWEIHRQTAIKTWEAVRDGVMAVIKWFQANVVPAIQTVVAGIKAYWDRFGADTLAVARTTFNTVVTMLSTFIQNFLAPFKVFLAVLRGDWQAAWDEIKGVFTRTWNAIKTILSGAIDTALTLAKAIGKAILDGLWAGLQGVAGKVADAMQRVWDALRTAATTAYNLAFEIGSKIVSGIWDGFKGLIGGIKDKISSAIGGIISGIDIPGLSPPRHAAAEAIGKPLAHGVIDGFVNQLRNRGPEIGQAIKEQMTDSAGQDEEEHGKLLAQKEANFLKDMRALQRRFQSEKSANAQFMSELATLFAEYGIKATGWGQTIGQNLADGLRDKINEVRKAAQDLAQVIKDNLGTNSPAREGPLASLDRWWDDFVPTLLEGIPAFNGVAAPGSGRAMGGIGATPTIIVNVSGSVLSERDLVDVVQRGIIEKGRRTGYNLLGGYA